MRIEDAGARTWLGVALAGWAVCVWVLAMFGMGGSIDRLDDDPALRQALPSPAAPGAGRLGPLAQYGDIAGRPLFTEDRRPQAFVIDPMGDAGEASNDFDYVLTSVLRTPALQMVILQPSGGGEPLRVKQGDAPDSAPGWVLQSVEPRRAVFAGPEGSRELELRVFDGVGGQSPTPMSVAAPAGAEPGAPMAVADADMVVSPRATGGPQPGRPDTAGAGPIGPDGLPAPSAAAQQQAAQDQVEAIRRRIEERRARLRADEMSQASPRPTPNQNN